MATGEGVPDRVREIAPVGVDVLSDLVGGDALRELAPLAKDPSVIVSAADARTATELGVPHASGPMECWARSPGWSSRASSTPIETYPLEKAAEAVASVETGHSRGKIVTVR